MTVKTQTHAMFFCFVLLSYFFKIFCLFVCFFLGGVLCFFGFFFFLQQPFFIARMNQQRKHLTILIDTK